MQRWSIAEAAQQRSDELLAEAAHARLVARARSMRTQRLSGRKRVARALVAVGYFLLDAGHSLELDSWRST